ncbi:TMV resistance protein N-like [Juglans microcarpa x Juglans regia]|uniref:TMV resistance protein N-like n=1 Tax=Juglans microcarpa x Juglans regia TaxID=2249226 RepID=UPI001B7DAE71|nr:TMV resistance protein N-like [Juglans microcarpa x Juglans regia]
MSYSKRLRTAHSYIPSSYSESEPKEHDVFLSFRGEDTRNTFTDHLYQALVDKGISTFMDDEKIGIGKPISPELLLAIEKSSVAVIVLSRNYASSTWCLQELAKIIECMKEREMRVLPIFYHVDPSDVRNQKGTFADAFAEHEIRFEKNLEKVRTWRNALREVANLSGRHLQNGRESVFIKTIVDSISRELSDTLSIVDEDSLIGIKYPVRELLNSHLKTSREDEVRFIGLCGMSGIGKTTVARVVFQRIRLKFQACSFLDNVSAERNVDALLEKLLSDMKLRSEKEKWDGRAVIKNRLLSKKVLIVLDDVDKIEQLETLVGNCNWFGKGSRIIITTKDKHLLIRHGVPDENIYMVKGLNEYGHDLDLKLFCRKAFRKPNCEIDFLDLCKDFVHYASGHPLALKVLGSSLFGKGREVWQSDLAKLKAIPNEDIQKKLQIGFDALGRTEKKLFLDIACFFNGDYKDRVIDLLQGLYCYPTSDIETLVDKSLLTSSGKRLWMHNLLQQMSWEIVRCEHQHNPGKWSRLWLSDDILQVLKQNTGTDNVEGIMMNTPPHEEQLNANAFSNMKRLGLLKICNVHLSAGLGYLSNELRLMEWHEYPLTSMPNNFQPHNLVELIMPRCRFEQLPKGFRNLNKLKVLDLSDSQNLIKTPDFTGFSNLQRLILQGCTRLYEVHPSMGVLNRLVLLNLKDCQSLASLPYEINLESLKTVILSGCSNLIKFPEVGENMKRLSELYLDKTAIEEVPLSIQNLTGLTLLNLSGCKQDHPSELWHSMFCLSALTSLVALDLSDCNLSDGAIPGDLSGLSSLESLNLSRNNFTRLPDSISQLSKLKFLYLDNCSKLKLLPNFPSGTQLVMARECSSLENCSNQVTVWTSYETGFTIINCLSYVDDEKSKVSLQDLHFQPLWRQYREEPIQHGKGFLSTLPDTQIPKWFHHQNYGSSVSIPLPPDLSKNSSWRGIALYTVSEVEKNLGDVSPGQKSHNIHELTYHFDMQDGADLEDCTIFFHPPKDQSGVDLYRLCLYISHARFRDHLDRRSCISPSILTNSPSVRFKACGARILYEHDMVEFIHILSQKGRGIHNLPSSRRIEDFKRRFLGDATEKLQDFDGSSVYNLCFSGSIQNLFPSISRDPSVTFDSPSNWYKDGTWMGLALYASFDVLEHSSTKIDGDPNTQVPNKYHLTLSLNTDMGSLERFQTYCLTEEDLALLQHPRMLFGRRSKLGWLCYMPRGLFPDWLSGCSFIEASIGTNYPGLTMYQCGFRLVFQHDVLFQEILQILDACPDERRRFINPKVVELL